MCKGLAWLERAGRGPSLRSRPWLGGGPDLSPASAPAWSSPEIQGRRWPRRQPSTTVLESWPPALWWVSLGTVLTAPRSPQRLGSQHSLHQLVLPSCLLGSPPNKPSTSASLPPVLLSGSPAEGNEHTPHHHTATESTLPWTNFEKRKRGHIHPTPILASDIPTAGRSLGRKGGERPPQREAWLGAACCLEG